MIDLVFEIESGLGTAELDFVNQIFAVNVLRRTIVSANFVGISWTVASALTLLPFGLRE